MLKLTTFLEKYENCYFLIRDNDGNIIYPKNKESLNLFHDILGSECNENGFYMYNDFYFEGNSQVMIEDDKMYIIESLIDVTKFEEETTIAKTDVVTNLSGKRLTYEQFNTFIMGAINLERPFACAIADADHFKNINDTYGHLCGDEMLKSLGTVLYNNTRHLSLRGIHVLRGKDIVGRIGGEEFLVVINNTSLLQSYNIMNSIRKKIEKTNIEFEDKTIPSCTMSFGMYYVDVDELRDYSNSDETIDEIRNKLLDKCDKALYSSKLNGRNCVNVYGIKNNTELEEKIKNKSR